MFQGENLNWNLIRNYDICIHCTDAFKSKSECSDCPVQRHLILGKVNSIHLEHLQTKGGRPLPAFVRVKSVDRFSSTDPKKIALLIKIRNIAAFI